MSDHDPNPNTYTWLVSGKLAHKFLNSANSDVICSDVFEIGAFKWQIEAYPNGYNPKNKGFCCLFVRLLTIRNDWERIKINRTILCINTNTQRTSILDYTKNQCWGWKAQRLPLPELKNALNLNHKNNIKIEFKITIQILQVILNSNRTIFYSFNPINIDFHKMFKFEWNLSCSELFQMCKSKKFNQYKCYESSVFNQLWYLRFYPFGNNEKNEDLIQIGLSLYGLPANVSELKCEYEFIALFTDDLHNNTDMNIDIFSYSQPSWLWKNKMGSDILLKKINNNNQLVDVGCTVICHIKVTHVVFKNGQEMEIREDDQVVAGDVGGVGGGVGVGGDMVSAHNINNNNNNGGVNNGHNPHSCPTPTNATNHNHNQMAGGCVSSGNGHNHHGAGGAGGPNTNGHNRHGAGVEIGGGAHFEENVNDLMGKSTYFTVIGGLCKRLYDLEMIHKQTLQEMESMRNMQKQCNNNMNMMLNEISFLSNQVRSLTDSHSQNHDHFSTHHTHLTHHHRQHSNDNNSAGGGGGALTAPATPHTHSTRQMRFAYDNDHEQKHF